VGRDGNLYYLSRGAGALYKIIYNKTTIPYITGHPLSLTVVEGEAATFAVSVLGSTPLEYQWEKDGNEILNATGATYSINASPADEGDYRVVVSNDAGNIISNIATLSVISNARPTASIIFPMDSSLYTAGTEISFSGTGIDPEDGELPPNAFQWQVDFHHDSHKHDQPHTPGVVNGSFFVPDEGETSDNVWYTILLTITDSKGSTAKDSVRILPRKSVISLTTDPPGLEILVDGQPVSTPVEIISVEGMKRSFGVESPQVVDGKEFEFEGWSNNREIIQTLTTPVQDTSLTARFTITVGTENAGTNGGNMILFPNPVTEDFCTVQFAVVEAQDVSIRLVNILAQQVFAVTKSLAAGKHSVLINAGQASPGIYYVMINTKGWQVSRRLIVARQN
jgi:hypothetical protein